MLAGNVGRNRYKIAIFVLMSVASAICVMLVAARIAVSLSGREDGLVWNLGLAWIPCCMSSTTGHSTGAKPLRS